METFPSKNIAISWVEKGSLTRNLFLSLGFAIITALSAQIRVVIPISPVPITGQTFVVLLAGLVLGSTFGAVSMLMYLFIGMSGLPFFLCRSSWTSNLKKSNNWIYYWFLFSS